MIRATTPRHIFGLEFPYEGNVKKILITYKQGEEIVVEKTEKDVSVENEKDVVVNLTQEETNRFLGGKPVEIQLRVLTEGNDALASDPILLMVENVLNDEVLK
jgi:hypothetical protein